MREVAAASIWSGARSHDFGAVRLGQVLSRTFEVRNSGKARLMIARVVPSCDCTAVLDAAAGSRSGSRSGYPIAPGKTATFQVTIDTRKLPQASAMGPLGALLRASPPLRSRRAGTSHLHRRVNRQAEPRRRVRSTYGGSGHGDNPARSETCPVHRRIHGTGITLRAEWLVTPGYVPHEPADRDSSPCGTQRAAMVSRRSAAVAMMGPWQPRSLLPILGAPMGWCPSGFEPREHRRFGP